MAAPQPALGNAVLLTADGRRRLEARMLQATEGLRELAERLGDQSGVPTEEYRRLLRQVEELRSVLERAHAPKEVPDDPAIVEVGDEVLIEYDDGNLERHVVVAPVEATLGDDRVSVAAPLGRALVGRSVGDRVTVEAPAGAYTCTIREHKRAT